MNSIPPPTPTRIIPVERASPIQPWGRAMRWTLGMLVALALVVGGFVIERNDRNAAICQAVNRQGRVLRILVDGASVPTPTPEALDPALAQLIEAANQRAAETRATAERLLAAKAC